MRFATFILSSLLILAWWTRTYAQTGDAPKPVPVVLNDEQERYPLGLHLEILEDPSGELTIEDVDSPEFDSQFVPSQVEVPNYGFTESAYWVRLHLIDETGLTDHWLLEVRFANTQFVDLYFPSPDGEGFAVKQTGVLRPVSTRDVLHPHIVFKLTLPPQSQQTYYLRFQNGASMTLPLTLWSPDAFLVASQQDLLQYGLFFGLMFGLLAYNLFLLFSLREASYLYLTFFLANMIFFEATYAGYDEAYLIPNLYYLKPIFQELSFALIFVSMLLFSDSFLEAKTRIPNLHRGNIAILSVWGVLMILAPFISYHNAALLMMPWALLSLMAVLTAGIISWRRDFRPARFFILAWFGVIITLLIVILVRIGVISSTFFAENAYHPGLMWMAVCWSIALSDRINVLKAETEGANRALQNSERRLSQILDGLPIGVVVYGKDQKPTFVNQRVTKILGNPARGIEPEITAGRTLSEAMEYYSFRVKDSNQEYPLENLPVYRALQGESASADDAEADLIDRRVPLEIWASPVVDDAGGVESAVVAFQDITQRKQAEKELRASEKKFRVIVENAFDGIVFMTRDREVLYVSPSYARLNGMNVGDMIGKSGVGFVHPDDRARIAEVFGELLQRQGGKVTVEYRSRHQDGSWIWVETNAVNLLDDPRVRAVVLNIRDITERKQTEAEIDEYRQQLESLVEERTAELSATNEWLSTLNQVRLGIGGAADLPQAYDRLFASILQLLDARLAFLLRWNTQDGRVEPVFLQQRGDANYSFEEIVSIFKDDSRLRKEIDLGEPIYMPADQAASLPGSLGEFFRKDESQSLIIMPTIIRQPFGGVLGVTLLQPVEEITPAQAELVKTMAQNLAYLAEGARLLDQAQALVVTEERHSLASELHDSVTQMLFSASLLAEATPRIWDKDQEIARMNLEKLSVLIRGALAEMRSLLFELRSGGSRGQSLERLLTTLVDAVRARTQLDISLQLDGDPELPENVIQAFYRISREALNNVIVHSEATGVTISIVNEPRWAELRILDDGRGFDPEEITTGHLGIGIMAERAAKIGGDLQVTSAPGQGAEIVVTWSPNGGGSGENG